jgi:4-nitrophenyl phosphatase
MIRYPLYIFDLDGTLYRGDEPILHAPETVRELKATGSGIRYLTNNSGQTREFFLAKLQRMGFPAELHEIESSAHGAAKYLESKGLHSIFAVGEAGLVLTLREEGLTVVNADGEGVVSPDGGDSAAVVVGICRRFTYDLMSSAMQRIRSGQAFVATNTDATFPLEGSRLVPGAGSVVAAIRTCSEQDPFVVGKPNPYLITLILEAAGCPPSEALVVGDRLDTDLVSGEAAGCPTHLVLTGVTHTPPPNQSCSADLTALLTPP